MESFKSDGARTGLFFGATTGATTTLGPALAALITWGMLVIVVLSHFIGVWVATTFG